MKDSVAFVSALDRCDRTAVEQCLAKIGSYGIFIPFEYQSALVALDLVSTLERMAVDEKNGPETARLGDSLNPCSECASAEEDDEDSHHDVRMADATTRTFDPNHPVMNSLSCT